MSAGDFGLASATDRGVEYRLLRPIHDAEAIGRYNQMTTRAFDGATLPDALRLPAGEYYPAAPLFFPPVGHASRAPNNPAKGKVAANNTKAVSALMAATEAHHPRLVIAAYGRAKGPPKDGDGPVLCGEERVLVGAAVVTAHSMTLTPTLGGGPVASLGDVLTTAAAPAAQKAATVLLLRQAPALLRFLIVAPAWQATGLGAGLVREVARWCGWTGGGIDRTARPQPDDDSEAGTSEAPDPKAEEPALQPQPTGRDISRPHFTGGEADDAVLLQQLRRAVPRLEFTTTTTVAKWAKAAGLPAPRAITRGQRQGHLRDGFLTVPLPRCIAGGTLQLASLGGRTAHRAQLAAQAVHLKDAAVVARPRDTDVDAADPPDAADRPLPAELYPPAGHTLQIAVDDRARPGRWWPEDRLPDRLRQCGRRYGLAMRAATAADDAAWKSVVLSACEYSAGAEGYPESLAKDATAVRLLLTARCAGPADSPPRGSPTARTSTKRGRTPGVSPPRYEKREQQGAECDGPEADDAEVGEEHVIGVVCCSFVDSTDLDLRFVGVLAPWRRFGLGPLLVAACIDTCAALLRQRAHGVTALAAAGLPIALVSLVPMSIKAWLFFHRLGFWPEGPASANAIPATAHVQAPALPSVKVMRRRCDGGVRLVRPLWLHARMLPSDLTAAPTHPAVPFSDDVLC